MDICDEETRQTAAEGEKRLVLKTDDYEDDGNSRDKAKSVSKKNKKADKKKVKLSKQTETSSESEREFDDSDDDYDDTESNKVSGKNKKCQKIVLRKSNHLDFEVESINDSSDEPPTVKKKPAKKKRSKKSTASNDKKAAVPVKKQKMPINDSSKDEEASFPSEDEASLDLQDQTQETDSEKEDDGVWEDIYGRKRSKDGDVIAENKQKYITPALRSKEIGNNSKMSEKLLALRRQMKGLLNRLAESNMHAIVSQVREDQNVPIII